MALGKHFNQGFFKTVIGSVIRVGIPLLGPARLIQRLPRTVPSAFPGTKVSVEAFAEKHMRATFESCVASPPFVEGVMRDAATHIGIPIELTQRPGSFVPNVGYSFALEFKW